MGAPISKTERFRAQRRGFQLYIEEQQGKLDDGVYDEELSGYLEREIARTEEKIAAIDREIGEDDPDRVLDEEREEEDEDDYYETDQAARNHGFASKKEGNEHDRAFRRQLNYETNSPYRVEAQFVEDLASAGLTTKDIYGLFDDYCDLYEEAVRMFGG
jgi:hypothetical protein